MATNIWDTLAMRDYTNNPWNYAQDYKFGQGPSITQQYQNSKNWLGVSKLNNPFSKGNIRTTAKNFLTPAINIAGAAVNKGASNSVGNTLTALSGVASAIPGGQWIGAGLAGAGLIANGLTNTVNKEYQKAVNSQIGDLANTVSTANNAQELDAERRNWGTVDIGDISNWGQEGFVHSIFGGTSKREKARNMAISNLNTALAMRANNQNDRALGINYGNTMEQMRNLTAFGGPIEVDPSTAIGYSLYTDRYRQNNNKDASSIGSLFAGAPNNMLAFGGINQTNGATFSDGLVHIDSGGSHEQNENQGVQIGTDNQGVPNLVEEGETIYNDYVFSNRLIVPRGKRGNYGKRNKYAKGGKLNKEGNKEEIPYEEQVLKPFEGLTFADAAKKAERMSGVTERPNDPIATRGFESTLDVLMASQEREREKEKLQEIQEAIDNMTPEEFMALQQQMQATQQQYEQQEALAQQQQMIPQGMEQMVPQEQMMAAYGGPIYQLGGILNTPENTYAYGGSFDNFTKELQSKGLTIEDYLKYLVDTGKIDQDAMDFYLLSDNNRETLKDTFNKDLAEDYINTLNTKEKEVARIYKQKGQNPNKLTGAALQKYKEDVALATKNPELLKEDTNKQLFINNVNKISPTTFNNIAKETIKNDYLKERTLNDDGKLSIRYNNEGTIPQGLSFLNDGVTYDENRKAWLNRAGEVVENPFTKNYGFTDVARDWNSWGYIDKEGKWHSVDAPQPSTSGNTDYRFTPTAEWSKDLGNASDYEQQDFYIENDLDFIEALNKGNRGALQRLYTLGEATKSNNPEERRGKNRYFREGADFNNLKKEDVIGYDPNSPENGIFGNKFFTSMFGVEAPKDRNYYINNKDKFLVGQKNYEDLSEEEKKNYTKIQGPITREQFKDNLRWAYNQYPESWKQIPNDLYLQGRSDNVWGPHHLISNQGTKRYAYVDEQGNFRRDANNNIRYINFDPNATYQYYNEGKPLEGQSQFINGVNVDTIGILGGNVENHIGVRRNPDGTWKTYDLTDDQIAKLKPREILSNDDRYKTLPQFDNAVEGYNFTPHYYEIDDEAYKSLGLDVDKLNGPKGSSTSNYSTENEPFPKAPTWPLWAGLGLQLGTLGYNILSPKDYSNADAMIKASQDAGEYIPIGAMFAGQQLPYNPAPDTLYGKIQGQTQGNARNIINNSRGNIGATIAGLNSNTYLGNLALGDAHNKWRQGNWNMLKDAQTFGLQRDSSNYDRLLKADMANQAAAARAKGFTLEGLKSGYAMRQAIDDAKANAINAGISGLGNLLYTYAQNKYNQDLLGWGMKRNVYGPGVYYKEDALNETAKGGKIRRRKKGLSF